MDERVKNLAKNIIRYALNIEKGMNVTIDVYGEYPSEFIQSLIKEINAVKAQPFVQYKEPATLRQLLLGITESTAKMWKEHDMNRLHNTDVYIMIKSLTNSAELADVSEDRQRIYGEHYLKDVNKHIVNKTRWISLRYPNASMAQSANMSTESFEDYFFQVCGLDYSALSGAMDHLRNLMLRTDKVRITGPETDLTFSIKGIPAHSCAGHINLPDGEVYTAPVRESMNGTVAFNVPSIYNGVEFSDLKLTFEHGKIVDASSSNTDALNKILDTDEGARFIGEFALGVNPCITQPIKDILFDEKIGGSFHLTPGFCYDNASNGNTSSIHWDMICIQTEEYGGGEIYFDNVLIRKDGVFVDPELSALNIKID